MNDVIKSKNEKCYLCGSQEDLTNDHIPPVSFFPSPKPDNLITVKCCRKCNHGFSLEDEAFRIFASSQIKRSQAGEWIWKNKVMQSSFKRSPKLKENVIKSLVPLGKNLDKGETVKWGLTYPIARGEKFLIRLTKGMLKHYFPEIDYTNSQFEITHIIPNQEIIDNSLSKFMYDEKGNGVFRVWAGLIEAEKSPSIWVYVFYDALMFMVEVDLDTLVT